MRWQNTSAARGTIAPQRRPIAQQEAHLQMRPIIALVVAGVGVALASSGASAQTLEQVKQRGQVLCGVTPSVAGFALPDQQGNWTGLDVDYCRGIAAAVLGDAKKVKFVPVDTAIRFEALKSGAIDVLVRVTTWSLSRDSSKGLDCEATNYYDGQSLMVRKKL